MTISAPLFICLLLVACLTAVATAIRSVSRIWLRHWVEQRLRGAPSAELFLERPQRLLLAAATGIAVTVYVAGALIGAIGGVSLPIVARRLVVFAIDERVRGPELALRIAQSRYSRVPIYRDTLDNVIGMIHAFDVLKDTDGEHVKLRPVADAPITARCNDFLFAMLRGRLHLAVVRDAAGRLAGIVTLEDLLEELVGDIRDEHDEPGVTNELRVTTTSAVLSPRPNAAPGPTRELTP